MTKLYAKGKEDFYYTPRPAIDDILSLGFIKAGHTVLEPCAGSGNIIQAIKDWREKTYIVAVEIESTLEESLRRAGADYIIMDNFMSFESNRIYDRIITNPPFNQMEKFIRKCYTLLVEGGRMAFLLRMSLLNGLKRYNLFKQLRPSEVYITSHRPRFTGNRNDTCGYAWVIWDYPITTDDTILRWIAPPGVR